MQSAAQFTDRWVDTALGRLFTRTWGAASKGSGAPILLFHDSLGCVALWRDFPANLSAATHRPVVAYDRLGFGRSDPHPGTLTSRFVADEANTYVPAIRAQLGLSEFVCMGHSVGGAMAVLSARNAGCRSLITESAQAFVEERTLNGIRAAKHGFHEPRQLGRLERYHGAKARWVLNAWTESWLSPEFQTWTLEADLPHVICRTLVIHGGQDEYGSLEHPARIAAGVSGPAAQLILPDCGHVPHRESEAEVLAAIRDFLARPSV